ncbi:MAG: hypothetical protein CG441_1866, partial [Methylococcaceae bacterium NSM2-1]
AGTVQVTHYVNFDAFRTSIDSCIADPVTSLQGHQANTNDHELSIVLKKPDNLTVQSIVAGAIA